jgi:hypothetical protein
MTQDEVIEMAVKAGMNREVLTLGRNVELLEAFAKVVAKRTKERIFKRAEIAAELAIEHALELEREACIDIVAMFGGSIEIEAAIRARGQK